MMACQSKPHTEPKLLNRTPFMPICKKRQQKGNLSIKLMIERHKQNVDQLKKKMKNAG